MTTESLSKIVEQSLNSVLLQDIKDAKKIPLIPQHYYKLNFLST